MMPFRLIAALALAGAACGVKSASVVPVVDIEFQERAPRLETNELDVAYSGAASFSVSIGADPDEGGAQQDVNLPASSPETVAPSSPESGVDQSADHRAHNPEVAGSSPAPATPAAPDTVTVDNLLEILRAVREENDPWRDFALSVLDRLVRPDAAPKPESSAGPKPAPTAEPEPAAFVGSPAPDPQLRRIVEDREGRSATVYEDLYGNLHVGIGHALTDTEIEELYDDDLRAHEAEARRVLGARTYDRLDRWRQNAWIVLCFSAVCSGFDAAIAATRAGDWHAAADEFLDSDFAREPKHTEYARMLAGWVRTGRRDQ